MRYITPEHAADASAHFAAKRYMHMSHVGPPFRNSCRACGRSCAGPADGAAPLGACSAGPHGLAAAVAAVVAAARALGRHGAARRPSGRSAWSVTHTSCRLAQRARVPGSFARASHGLTLRPSPRLRLFSAAVLGSHDAHGGSHDAQRCTQARDRHGHDRAHAYGAWAGVWNFGCSMWQLRNMH